MAARNFDSAGNPLRVFGAELRHYRTSAGLSQEQLGVRISFSGDLVGKVENGQRAPTDEFTTACDAVPELKTDGALTRLREHLKETLKYRATPGWFWDWTVKEAQATTLRSWEPLLVPGLAQTPGYARAVLSATPGASEEETGQRVEARLERQRLLHGDFAPMFFVLVDEGVLRREIGGPEVMREQLGHLLDLAARPRVFLQVVPLSAQAHPGLAGPLVLASFDDAADVAYLDNAIAGQLVDSANDIAMLTLLYDVLRGAALSCRESEALVREVMETWS
jgi:transcriptional regulator with XRE-family HTH domain